MSTELIVAKFGGSSMADAKAMQRSAKVATSQKANLIVVSATYGTTNDLLELSSTAITGKWENCKPIIDRIYDRHKSIANDLDVSKETRDQMFALLLEVETLSKGICLLRDCSAKALDSLQSLGERLSSTLFVRAMNLELTDANAEFLDVRKVLRTDDNFGKAMPNIEEIEKLCEKELVDCQRGIKVYVTQGFIGSTEEGLTTTLGRGGSDYSAALLAEGIGADILQIWTDVAGIATTDPRIVPEASLLPEISFQEAAELAAFGAKILHPTTLVPASRKDIKVFVGSSYEADKNGTWIVKECETSPLIRAMATKKGQSLLTLSTPKMLHAHGFLYEIFKIFNDHKVSVDSITTSEISVSLTVDDATLVNKRLIQDLSELANVKIEENLALVSLIGNNINHTHGLASDIFSALKDINVRMICLGASKHNFCVLVQEDMAHEAIKRLHKNFI
jgi:aspartate kinase